MAAVAAEPEPTMEDVAAAEAVVTTKGVADEDVAMEAADTRDEAAEAAEAVTTNTPLIKGMDSNNKVGTSPTISTTSHAGNRTSSRGMQRKGTPIREPPLHHRRGARRRRLRPARTHTLPRVPTIMGDRRGVLLTETPSLRAPMNLITMWLLLMSKQPWACPEEMIPGRRTH